MYFYRKRLIKNTNYAKGFFKIIILKKLMLEAPKWVLNIVIKWFVIDDVKVENVFIGGIDECRGLFRYSPSTYDGIL